MNLKFSVKQPRQNIHFIRHRVACVCLYSEVDENPDYDNLDIVSRDAEDKYFDEDDEEYDQEEETMTE